MRRLHGREDPETARHTSAPVNLVTAVSAMTRDDFEAFVRQTYRDARRKCETGALLDDADPDSLDVVLDQVDAAEDAAVADALAQFDAIVVRLAGGGSSKC